jgi:signal transduction histidine kinase
VTPARQAAPAQDVDWQRAFISEVFHDLSQPLTALQCSLDLALRRDGTLEQLRASIQAALQDAERLRQRLILLRTLSEASDPGDLSTPADLNSLLRELHEDLRPLFDSEGKQFALKLKEEPVLVRGNRAKLSNALFCLLEYLFLYSPAGAIFLVELRRNGHARAEIEIAAATCVPLTPSAKPDESSSAYSCEIEFARRTFRAAGGDLLAISSGPDRSVWRVNLPLAG